MRHVILVEERDQVFTAMAEDLHQTEEVLVVLLEGQVDSERHVVVHVEQSLDYLNALLDGFDPVNVLVLAFILVSKQNIRAI